MRCLFEKDVYQIWTKFTVQEPEAWGKGGVAEDYTHSEEIIKESLDANGKSGSPASELCGHILAIPCEGNSR